MPKGRVVIERISSAALSSNPLGDPVERDLLLYLPPSYDNTSTTYPVVFCLSGFTGSGQSWFNFQPWTPRIDQRMDALIESGVREMILVFPDCFTRLGGSQYINSPAVGDYSTYLVSEIVPFVDQKFRTANSAAGRAIIGKSSGGYGALMNAALHPGIFSAVACHSGDMYFDYCYLPEFPVAYRQLKKIGGLLKFFEDFETLPKTGKQDHALINIIAMAACYGGSPQIPFPHFQLPFDPETGRLNEEVWALWKEKDPLVWLKNNVENLRKLGLIFFDCGKRDEFYLDIGAGLLDELLNELRIPHIYESFNDGHFNISRRYDVSLRRIGEFFQESEKVKSEK